MTRYIGLDIHKRYTFYTELGDDGTVVARGRLHNSLEAFQALVAERPGPVKATMESTFNWYYLYDLVAPLVDELTLAHPGRISAFRTEPNKTDRRSADLLAQLTQLGLVPVAYVPPREVRDLRELLRYRAVLVKLDGMLKRRVRSVLDRLGHPLPHRHIFGKQAQQVLLALNVREPYPLLLRGFLALHAALAAQLNEVTDRIQAAAEVLPTVRRLMTLPRVSYYTALLLWVEIGDINRFPTPKHLASYAGLVPSVHQSGQSQRHGPITRAGSPWLRWILVEAAHRAVWVSPRFRSFFYRVVRRKGKKTAIVAVAHKLLHVIYHMLKAGRGYQEVQG